MRRRSFLVGFGAVVAAVDRGWAQRSEMTRRIGVLSQGSIRTHPTRMFKAFLERLGQLGWLEGQNLEIEWRFSEGSADPLAQLARELVDKKSEVIVASPTQPVVVAQQAAAAIPIVFVQIADPVQAGIVTNLARPGGNATGMSTLSTDLAGKRLELLREALPGMTRVSVLWNRPSRGAALVLEEMKAAANSLGLELHDIGISEVGELEHAFQAAVSNRSSAVVVNDDPVMNGYSPIVLRIAAEKSVPVASVYSQYAIEGALMAYGPDLPAMYRRAAEYVDRILRGEKPGSLPVEQPSKFTLVINLKVAKALGIGVPPTLLARADEVIE